MSVLDIILCVLVLLGLVRGFMKGFFVEVASLIALVAGVYGAIHFSVFAEEFLINKVDWNEKTINIIAFAITFIVIVLVIGLAGKALTKLADFAALGIINKLLGSVFGALKTTLILSVLLIIFEKANNTLVFVNDENLEDSALYKPIKSIVPMLFPGLINIDDDDKQNLPQSVIKVTTN
ncbi:colicin V production protein [Pseudalgibacter alginicilyticus]|uniref:Colicin V production protein n=1 Tax=Pseudalgibacter alginicilyticus TaxID=1736674 RepID=A0A0P0DC90_9FLAO|nr:CvpA family protein [Pseudalgibacter alginicilyticus]ALJ05729.1 colicin V production protein [Pseudalgibacter alginicilyticus]